MKKSLLGLILCATLIIVGVVTLTGCGSAPWHSGLYFNTGGQTNQIAVYVGQQSQEIVLQRAGTQVSNQYDIVTTQVPSTQHVTVSLSLSHFRVTGTSIGTETFPITVRDSSASGRTHTINITVTVTQAPDMYFDFTHGTATIAPTQTSVLTIANAAFHNIGTTNWTVGNLDIVGMTTSNTMATIRAFMPGQTTVTAQIFNSDNSEVILTLSTNVTVSPAPTGMALVTVIGGTIQGGVMVHTDAQAILVNTGTPVTIRPLNASTTHEFAYFANRTNNSVLAWRHHFQRIHSLAPYEFTFTANATMDIRAVAVNADNLVGLGVTAIAAPGGVPPWTQIDQTNEVFLLGNVSGNFNNTARTVSNSNTTIALNYFRTAANPVNPMNIANSSLASTLSPSTVLGGDVNITVTLNFAPNFALVRFYIIWVPEEAMFVAIRHAGPVDMTSPFGTTTRTWTVEGFRLVKVD